MLIKMVHKPVKPKPKLQVTRGKTRKQHGITVNQEFADIADTLRAVKYVLKIYARYGLDFRWCLSHSLHGGD
jgi:hypothetical protein